MNKIVIAVLVFAVVLVGGYFLLQSQKATGPATSLNGSMNEPVMEQEAVESANVTMSNFAFSSKTIKVKVGGSVTWTNNDSVSHTATGDNGEFDTGLIGKGESKSITFDEVGTFTYHCTPHPNMQASVVVE